MMNRERRIGVVLVGALIVSVLSAVGFAAPAGATSCARPESADPLQAVVIATVVDKTSAGTRESDGERASFFRYDIDDVEVLHGAAPDNLVVEAPSQNGINLGLTLDVGTSYGFMFHRFDGNIGGVGGCSVAEPSWVENLARLVPPEPGNEFFAAPETPIPPSAGPSTGRIVLLVLGAIVGVAAIWRLVSRRAD